MQYGNAIDVYYTAELALNWQYTEVIKHDLMWFLPGLIVLLGTMLLFIVSEQWWIAGITFSSLVTLRCTIGLASWANFTLTAISGFVAVIIVILNVAYSIHLYFDWRHNFMALIDQWDNKRQATAETAVIISLDAKYIASASLVYSIKRNFHSLLWGAVTTAFGFILLRFSPSPAIQDFGT
jgi:predicted RND superfamily exporter protein